MSTTFFRRMKTYTCYRFLYSILCLLCIFSTSAQCVERGIVKEYQGKKDKTPLSGVELKIKGAPSTVSDKEGRFTLRFAKMKPGQNVKYNDIYKRGYVIFNKTELDNWRISNSQKPFRIIMCKENTLRKTENHYDRLIRKSYKEEFERQKALAERFAKDNEDLKTKLKRIQEEYEEKMSNISTYVDIFARIDRNEIDSTRKKALELLDVGQIDEAIKMYNQINLEQKAEEQIRNLHAGFEAKQVAQTIINDSHLDLLTLIDKAKEKIGIYQMGGEKYKKERNVLINHLIEWYTELNNVLDGQYNEELGKWICVYADYAMPWENRIVSYQQAALLPSWYGLYSLAQFQLIMSYMNTADLNHARMNLHKALTMAPDTVCIKIKKLLSDLPDFYSVLSSGDTLFYKLNDQPNTVSVWPKTPFWSNRVSDYVILPDTVMHNGSAYRITSIGKKAFYLNRSHIHKMKLSDNIQSISEKALSCTIDTLVTGKGIQSIDKYALNRKTMLIVPPMFLKSDWYLTHKCRYDSINDEINNIHETETIKELLDNCQNDATELSMKEAKNKLLKKYVNVAQNIAKKEYTLLDNCMIIEYEELVSICILVVQTMIKDKTIEELYKYDEAYLYNAVKWAVRRELTNRYDWFKYFSYTYWHKNEYEEVRDNNFFVKHCSLLKRLAERLYNIQPNPELQIEEEEIFSIGAIALRALNNNKTKEELSQYSDKDVEALLIRVIVNELEERYDGFKDQYGKDWRLIGNIGIDCDLDTKRVLGRIHLFHDLYMYYKKFIDNNSNDLSENSLQYKQQVIDLWKKTESRIKNFSINNQNLLMKMIISEESDEDILKIVHEFIGVNNISIDQMNIILKNI